MISNKCALTDLLVPVTAPISESSSAVIPPFIYVRALRSGSSSPFHFVPVGKMPTVFVSKGMQLIDQIVAVSSFVASELARSVSLTHRPQTDCLLW